MANAISSASLMLGLNAAKLFDGLQTVTSKIKSWASSITGLFTGIFDSSIFGSISSKLIGDITSNLKLLGKGFLAGFGLAPEFFDEMMGRLDKLFPTLMKAKDLGIASDSFMGFAYALKKVGGDADSLSETFIKMAVHVRNTAAPLGTELKDWLSADMVEKSIMISRGMQQFATFTEKAAYAQQYMGKGFAGMLPLLLQGPERIQAWIDKAKDLGLALSQQDADQLIRAKKAQARLKDLWEGFKNRMLVAFAPLLEFFGNWLSEAQGPIKAFFDEASKAAKVYFQFMTFVWVEIKNAIDHAIESLAEFTRDSLGLGEGMLTTEEITKNLLRTVVITIGSVLDMLTPMFKELQKQMKNVVDVFKQIGQSIKSVPNFFKGLGDVLNPFKKFEFKTPSARNPFKDLFPELFDDTFKFKLTNWFDKLKWPEPVATAKLTPKPAEVLTSEYVQNPAALFGSQQAHEIVNRWRFMQEQNPLVGLAMKQNEKLGDIFGVLREMLDKQNDVVRLEVG